jgi:hypothetical protein
MLENMDLGYQVFAEFVSQHTVEHIPPMAPPPHLDRAQVP